MVAYVTNLNSESSQTMTQNRKESSNVASLFNQCTEPSESGGLGRRHFRHALASVLRKDAKRRYITEGPTTKSKGMLLINQNGSGVNQETDNTEELTLCSDTQSLIKLPRKFLMRDQNGDIVPNKRKARAWNYVMTLPSIKWSCMEGRNRVTLNVRSLKFGTLDNIFRGSLTLSVDCLEIPGEVRIEASQLTSCEWCQARVLPALFLQMTPAACFHHREQLGMAMGTGAWYDCQSKNQEEKYLIIIFESEPTISEKAALEEILAEIGSRRNVNNFPASLTFEEANNRLMAHKCSHIKQTPVPFSPISTQVETISVSDSEDGDDDLMECHVSHPQPVRKLLVYPPPPAKGGFSITEEDLACLNEGELLNDVILDFYLNTQEKRHNRVKTWTRHLDIFEKDFIFVPVNELSHWYLVVICFPGRVSQCSELESGWNRNEESWVERTPNPCLLNPMSLFYRQTASRQLSRWNASVGEIDSEFCFVSDDDMEEGIQHNGTTSGKVFSFGRIAFKQPCILIMDSLSCHAKPSVVKVLQEYLEMEWWVRKGSRQSFGKGTMNGWSLQVPLQDNGTDCGLYLLQYVESFITNPPQIFHPAVDLSDWFPQKLVKKKRMQIKRLIFRLHHQQLDFRN